MSDLAIGGVEWSLPCRCGARVPFTIGQGASGTDLICPACGLNIHLYDKHRSVQRAVLRSNAKLQYLRRNLRRLRPR